MSGDQRPAPLSMMTQHEESLKVSLVPEDSLAGHTGRFCKGRVSPEALLRIVVTAPAPSVLCRQWVESCVRRCVPVGLATAAVVHLMDMSLSKLQGLAMGMEAWRAAVHGVAELDSAELICSSTLVFTHHCSHVAHSEAQMNNTRELHPASPSWFLDTAHQLSVLPSRVSPRF